MPGEEPKSQHYVHRAYLEGFQDPSLEEKGESFVWAYMPGKSPFPQRPERLAKRNYYYCYEREEQRQFQAEHGLQKLEDLALPILRKFRDRRFGLSAEHRLTFAGYIALSHTRVPTFQKSMDRLASLIMGKQLEFVANDKRALEWATAKIREETGEEIKPEEFQRKLTGGTVEMRQTNREWSLGQMFQMMLFLQQVIFDMKWTFLLAPEDDAGFLTSDNPVSLFDPMVGRLGGIGFASSPVAHFTFPISRGVCLLAQHRRGPATAKLNGSKVRSVNKGTITPADSQLYAPFESASVQRLLDGVVSQRNTSGKVLLSKGRVVEESSSLPLGRVAQTCFVTLRFFASREGRAADLEKQVGATTALLR